MITGKVGKMQVEILNVFEGADRKLATVRYDAPQNVFTHGGWSSTHELIVDVNLIREIETDEPCSCGDDDLMVCPSCSIKLRSKARDLGHIPF